MIWVYATFVLDGNHDVVGTEVSEVVHLASFLSYDSGRIPHFREQISM